MKFNRNLDNIGPTLIAVVVVAIIIAAITLEVFVWNECRATNSFWYCLRVLSK